MATTHNFTTSTTTSNATCTFSVNETLLPAFDALNVSGFALLLFILVTLLLVSRIKRTATCYLLLVSQMVSALSYLLLIGHHNGANPPFSLCLAQSALIYSAHVFTSWSTMSFMTQLYLNMAVTDWSRKLKGIRAHIIRLLVGVPIILHVAFTISGILVGLKNPDSISREGDGMICHFNRNTRLFETASTFSMFGLLVVNIIQVMVFVKLYQHRKVMKELDSPSQRLVMSVAPSMLINIVLFSLLQLTTLGASTTAAILSFGNMPSISRQSWARIIEAIMPLGSAIILGLSKEFICVIRTWKNPSVANSQEQEECSQCTGELTLYHISADSGTSSWGRTPRDRGDSEE